MRKCVVAVMIISFICLPTFAVDLVNKDSQKYEVKIHDVGTTHSSIEGNTTKMGVCSDCEVEVVGVGSVKASGSEKIIIKDGKLSKE